MSIWTIIVLVIGGIIWLFPGYVARCIEKINQLNNPRERKWTLLDEILADFFILFGWVYLFGIVVASRLFDRPVLMFEPENDK